MRQFDWEGRLQESIEGEQMVWRGAINRKRPIKDWLGTSCRTAEFVKFRCQSKIGTYDRMDSGDLGVNRIEPDSEEDVPN